MSWSNTASVIMRAALVAGVVSMLGACSFSPVYSDSSMAQPMLELAFGKPTTRLEQVIYQDLALRFGRTEAETAPLATVNVNSAAATVGLSATSSPVKLSRITVSATLTLQRRDGTAAQPLTLTRQATAEYSTVGQVLTDTAAADDAAERAARAAGESLRLALLAALSR